MKIYKLQQEIREIWWFKMGSGGDDRFLSNIYAFNKQEGRDQYHVQRIIPRSQDK